MKRFKPLISFLAICAMMVVISSCNNNSKKTEIKSEIKSGLITEKTKKITDVLCKPGNYWFLYMLDDTISDKYIGFTNCWKFLPDHKIEIGWWDDEYGLDRNVIYGGCGTDMPYEEARDNINRIQWNIDEQYNVLSFDGFVLKITRINHDTIYFKNRYGTRILLINWGENVKKVKKEMPFNEKDTITLQDPFNDKALSQ